MGLWDKIKNYVGVGLTDKVEKVGKAIKKAGREPETNLQDAVSRPFRNSSNGKPVSKKKK